MSHWHSRQPGLTAGYPGRIIGRTAEWGLMISARRAYDIMWPAFFAGGETKAAHVKIFQK